MAPGKETISPQQDTAEKRAGMSRYCCLAFVLRQFIKDKEDFSRVLA